MADTKVKKTIKATPKPAKVSAAVKTANAAEVVTTLHRRSMTGIVVSDKMNKTRVVRVERRVRDDMYGKYITKSNKFKIHDENNQCKTGDLVSIVESRPLSREKRWALQKIIRSATGQVLSKS